MSIFDPTTTMTTMCLEVTNLVLNLCKVRKTFCPNKTKKYKIFIQGDILLTFVCRSFYTNSNIYLSTEPSLGSKQFQRWLSSTARRTAKEEKIYYTLTNGPAKATAQNSTECLKQ